MSLAVELVQYKNRKREDEDNILIGLSCSIHDNGYIIIDIASEKV